MVIVMASTGLTFIMFMWVFLSNLKKEDQMPTIINLLFMMLNVYVWIIMSDNEVAFLSESDLSKQIFSIMFIYSVLICITQFFVNILFVALRKTKEKELRKEKTKKEKS